MPDDDLGDSLLDRRLRAVAAAYAPDCPPPFDLLVGLSRRRRRSRAAAALVALALVAGVPTVLLPALRERGDGSGQTLAAAGTADGLCDDARSRYTAWLAADRGRLDLRRLERHEASATYALGPTTLSAARDQAERIVAGTVTDVHVDAQGSRTTVLVDRTVKGPRARELVVIGSNTLTPAREEPVYGPKSTTGRPSPIGVQTVPASLTVAPFAPLLLPGQQGVWLLDSDSRAGLGVRSVSGQYVICHGRVTATDGNPFAAEVGGWTESQLLTRLQG